MDSLIKNFVTQTLQIVTLLLRVYCFEKLDFLFLFLGNKVIIEIGNLKTKNAKPYYFFSLQTIFVAWLQNIFKARILSKIRHIS